MTEVVVTQRADRMGLAVALLAAVFMLIASIASAEEIPAAATQEADTVWQQRCSTCHGAGGKGDGAAAAALVPKPRDFTSADWQKSVTDDHLQKVILEGGQSVGLSMLMVPNADLAPKPDVVKALVAHVRGLGAK
ncbi:MAG TPA: c-type cytochrome [Candidatus Limnocylindrales bacterium]|nr:c-type cytochrome [Candidatus Limnocylindrales bacterium]